MADVNTGAELTMDDIIGELTCFVVVCFTGDLGLVFDEEETFSTVGCLDGLGDAFGAVDTDDACCRLLVVVLFAVDGRLCFLVPAFVGNNSK